MNDKELESEYATLKTPYRGYRNIQLIEETERGWLAEVCGSGAEIEVRDDDFIVDE